MHGDHQKLPASGGVMLQIARHRCDTYVKMYTRHVRDRVCACVCATAVPQFDCSTWLVWLVHVLHTRTLEYRQCQLSATENVSCTLLGPSYLFLRRRQSKQTLATSKVVRTYSARGFRRLHTAWIRRAIVRGVSSSEGFCLYQPYCTAGCMALPRVGLV
ncbi:hypothetical protein TRVA0_017S01354 [Trichomonascus vanleenenianus]|uniref:uncharacterized protein n=1 Tax=Trichomonascus vanleenenianus TaxID=2268995 RepID=UPI003EC9F186